ncbi:hypothetical protein K435DRAFT_937170 [Dendrothele bispora CBS 962.96]|uniref:GST N-terminal domain-containing protein n=1 Tax=Dendrothele bispora (strain CBS 962.96) TaxID=1314807 RepID=A0A4S8KZT8_DENBC|nr:hypothetical protein K435DRAFT_937170 [Dendrothele bispora CBS 962.96]
MSRSGRSSVAPGRSSTTPVITLYDIAGNSSPQPWAPNIWRVRFILNYKRLRYRTVWVNFADIERTLRSINAPPSSYRPDGRPVYTLPVIVDPTRNSHRPEILSNPNNIAEYLEALHPARPVFPEGSRALQTLFVHYIQEVFAKPLLPIMVPLSFQHMPHAPQQTLPPGPERERAWRLVKEQFDFLASVLDKNAGDGDGDGICAMGHRLTYADFALCSVLIWIENMATYDGWARVREWNGGRWARLKDKCRDYMDVF